MKSTPIYECFKTNVDNDDKYHKTFELAVKRIIKDSCDINAEPWGGGSCGKVFERFEFSIEHIAYVKDFYNKKVVIKNKNILSFRKDLGEGPANLYSIFGKLKNDNILHDRIYKGIVKRWTYGWRLVEKKEHKVS